MIQFLFPYRRDSVERENNLNEVLQFYKSKFPNEKFLVVEVGDEKTYNGDFPSIFQKQPLPHNQSKTLNFIITSYLRSHRFIILAFHRFIILVFQPPFSTCTT